MGVINDMLHDHPGVQQLIQNLRLLGVDSYVDIRDGHVTLTIRLFAMHLPDKDSTKDSSIKSEALLRKKKFMQSLLGARRHTMDTDFLKPQSVS
jgi:hypothetical protein